MHYNSDEILKMNELFLSNPRFEKLSDEIYLCRNFLTKQECENLIIEAKENYNISKNLYKSKSLFLYRDRLINLLNFDNQNNVVPDNINKDWNNLVLRVEDKNDTREFCFAPHVDIYNFFDKYFEESILEKKNGIEEEIDIGYLSFVIYFSENFDGGEIFYPEYNIKYKPKIGDIILHNVQIIHSVYKILNGERWSYQGSIGIKKYLDSEKKKKFDFDNQYYGECLMQNNIDNNPNFFYRVDQKPILNKRLLRYVNEEPYL